MCAGYFNTADRDGYLPTLMVLRKHGVRLQLSGGELGTDTQLHHALADPDALLLQIRACAAATQVPVSLSNQHVSFDAAALGELERKAFQCSCYRGIDVGQVGATVEFLTDVLAAETWTMCTVHGVCKMAVGKLPNALKYTQHIIGHALIHAVL